MFSECITLYGGIEGAIRPNYTIIDGDACSPSPPLSPTDPLKVSSSAVASASEPLMTTNVPFPAAAKGYANEKRGFIAYLKGARRARDGIYDAAARSYTRASSSRLALSTPALHIGELHSQIAEKLHSCLHLTRLEPVRVEDMSMFPKATQQPVVFQQLYQNADLPIVGTPPDGSPSEVTDFRRIRPNAGCFGGVTRQASGLHVFVLVHGFQGSLYDMRLLKNNISVTYGDAVLLCSGANQDNTEGDISEMGRRLADEVLTFIDEWCPGNTLSKLSFIGHSLGGIIVRTALKHLDRVSNKLHSFISLSSPHLGYMHSVNKLIDAGIWVLKKWRKSICLQQLTMTDTRDPRKSFLFELSLHPGLQRFQHVCLVSSYQDQYAPFDSARIELNSSSYFNKAGGSQGAPSCYEQMAFNILGKVPPHKLTRIDVHFRIPERTLDSFIGRTAHIQFLECQPLMKMILRSYTYLFS